MVFPLSRKSHLNSFAPPIHCKPLYTGAVRSHWVASPSANKAMGAMPSWCTEKTGYFANIWPLAES